MTGTLDPLERGRALADALRADDADAAVLVDELCAEIERVHRQLTRLGLDLHDGGMQDITALRNDLSLFRGQVAAVVEDPYSRERVIGRVDDFLARVVALDGVLRELVGGMHVSSALKLPLAAMLRAVVAAHPGPATVELALDPALDSLVLSDSQRIAVVRIVQSALANVAEHSGAGSATVNVRCTTDALECEIVDDGAGFVVSGAADGRLGLAGMRERVALLGGTFDVHSRVGGPTTVAFRLPSRVPGLRSSQR